MKSSFMGCRYAIWVLLGIAVVSFVATPVAAQLLPGGGNIHLFSDPDFTDSTYQDQSIASLTIYVVHRGVTYAAAHGVQFMVEASPGVTFSWIGESSPMPIVVGNSQSGIAIDYGACLFPDPGLILEIQYVGFGNSEPCSLLRVVPHPDATFGEIEVVLCIGMGPVSAVGKELRVNCAVSVEETTWGKVKSLYRIR